jgi:NAD-dependent SIR2 family protein deacetylase
MIHSAIVMVRSLWQDKHIYTDNMDSCHDSLGREEGTKLAGCLIPERIYFTHVGMTKIAAA